MDSLCTNVILKGCRESAVTLRDTKIGKKSREPSIQIPASLHCRQCKRVLEQNSS